MNSSRLTAGLAGALIGTILMAGCSPNEVLGTAESGSSSLAGAADGSDASGEVNTSGEAFFNTDSIQNISVTFAEADYEAMLQAYAESESKEWISAEVTINGTTYSQVGLRLKGNSSLRFLSGGGPGSQVGANTADEGDGQLDATAPESLPWLMRLDKFVPDQTHDGRTDFVVRGNNSESSLNEALALQVLAQAGVPAQDFAFTRFSVNGSQGTLRLVVDQPDDEAWAQSTLGTTGSVYKADSGGDYSYRGDDPDSYVDVFDQKYGTADLTPVMEFLDFINNSTDDEFATQLDNYLDVDAFATYLAGQELIHNSDDIDGPGNNSYLFYDESAERFTVVAWDHNLAYGQSLGGGFGGGGFGNGGSTGGMGGPGEGMERPGADGATFPGGATPPDGFDLPEGFEPPAGFEPPEGFEPPDGMEFPEGFEPPTGTDQAPGRGGFGGGNNPFVTRFLANEEFNALYEAQLATLQTEIVDSGLAQSWLDSFSGLLTDQASDLIDAQTVATEAEQISRLL